MLIFHSILVYIVIIFIIISLYFDLLGAGFTFLIGVTVLVFFGVLTPKEMLVGASNEQILVILMLLLLGNIYRKTALLDSLFNKIFTKVSSYKAFTNRVMLLIAPLSAFLNNTPLVALMMPYAYDWAKKHNQPISKILIPLSYAAILGGCTTLIGTSTNLIVNGMVVEAGLESLGLFDYSIIGLSMVAIGYLYMRFIGYRLLPANYSTSKISKNAREYVVEAKIPAMSPLINKTIKASNLKNLDGLFLFQIIREKKCISDFSDSTIIKDGDILMFIGDTAAIAHLYDKKKILILPSVGMFSKKKELELVEIVVSDNSILSNKTLKAHNFRSRFDATVIAVHRNGEQVKGELQSLKLKPGDALLLLTGNKFTDLAQNTKDFYFISKVKEIKKLTPVQSWTLIIGTFAAVILSSVGLIEFYIALVALIIILLFLNVTNPKDLAKSIDYDLAFIIAMALALGVAMQKTGVAEILATIMIDICSPWGNLGILIGLYVITAILAAFVTNKAAVALIFPIAITIATDLGHNPMPFILVVSFAAAANFMTPIGYQTNTMVYGPGNYKFKDFLKVGTPLTIIYGIVTIFILMQIYF